MGAGLALPQRASSGAGAGKSGEVRPGLQPANCCGERRVLFVHAALGFSARESGSAGFFDSRSARSEARSQGKGNLWRVLAIHLAGNNSVCREQSGQRPMVSGARTPCHCLVASLELRRDFVRWSLQGFQSDGNRGVAAEHALSRYPDAGGDQAR